MGDRKTGMAKLTALAVIGMARSGTSAMAGTLGLLGCGVPSDDLPASERNPKGFFESKAFLDLLEAALASIGLSEADWEPFPVSWFASEEADEFAKRGAALLDSFYATKGLIVFKNPRASRLYPLVEKILKLRSARVFAIQCFRNPVEVSRSVDGYALREGYLRWLRNVLDAESYTRGRPRSFVNYQSLLADWRSVIDRLEQQSGIPLPKSSETSEEVEAFIDKDLRHHRAVGGDLSLATVEVPWLGPTFRALERLEHDPSDKEALDRLDRIRAEFDRAGSAVSPLVRALKADLRRSWKALESEVAAHPPEPDLERVAGLRLEILDTKGGQFQISSAITSIYRTYFDRLPRPDEIEAWRVHIRNGGRFSDVQSELVRSPEGRDYSSRVIAGMYSVFVGCSPTLDDLVAWQRIVEAGTSFHEVEKMLASTEKAQGHLRLSIQNYHLLATGRFPSKEEVQLGLERVRNGESLNKLRTEITASPEAVAHISSVSEALEGAFSTSSDALADHT